MECRTLTSKKLITFVPIIVATLVLPLCGCAVGRASDDNVPRPGKSWNEPLTAAQPRVTPQRLSESPTPRADSRRESVAVWREPDSSSPNTHPQRTSIRDDASSSYSWPLPVASPYPQIATEGSTARFSRFTPIRATTDEFAAIRCNANPACRDREQPTVLHANSDSFEQQVLQSETPVLVDFYAEWCGPCKALAPVLDELAAETPQARIVKVNIDDSPEIAARYRVESVPSLLVFKDGRVTAQHSGLTSKSRLKSMLGL